MIPVPESALDVSRLKGRRASYPRRVTSAGGETLVAIRVIPRAKRNEVGGERAGRLLVRTTAAPVDGKANAAVCKQVAEHLGVPARRVTIESGHHSRDKVLRIAT